MRRRQREWIGTAARGIATGLVVATALAMLGMLGGCSAAGALLTVAGVATDTSVPWQIVKHVHGKVTEGDPVACRKLNSVERGLTLRCGAYEPGSFEANDIARTQLQECPLLAAARDTRLWPAIPELLDKGARLDACHAAPLAVMAQLPVDLSMLPPAAHGAIERLAFADPRSVQHDTVRLLSTPGAQQVGLARVLDRWLAEGRLPAHDLAFGPLGAMHPSYLSSAFARELEARGHRAQQGLGAYDGRQPSGFELALRMQQWDALDWWFARVPRLVDEVPPRQGTQVAWVPLAQVLVPAFVADDAAREATVRFLLDRGADPWARLPGQRHLTVVGHARGLKSPLVAMLESARTGKPAARLVLAAERRRGHAE